MLSANWASPGFPRKPSTPPNAAPTQSQPLILMTKRTSSTFPGPVDSLILIRIPFDILS